ncbi:MAG: DUF6798 domain-containing protein [Vicingaceae bacterium]
MSLNRSVGFLILIGILISFYKYYYFGGMQIDMLPIIYRNLDPNFLTNDFYTNVSAIFNEDFIFAKIVGWFTQFASLPIVFFSFTLLSNVGIALVSFFTARDLSQKNNLSGLIAAILAITLSTFQWGNRDLLFRMELTPEHLIMPLILLAIWMGIKQRPLLVGLFAGLATFSHPLTGPGIGGLLLLQILITQLWYKQINWSMFLKIGLGGVLCLLPLVLYLIPYYQSFDYQISDALFIEIMEARFPQHYLPSYFFTPLKTFTGLSFLAATFFAWKKWKDDTQPPLHQYSSLHIHAVILFVLCLLGWLFSEVWPTRLMFTLHPFRFLLILKFYGIVAFALYAGMVINSSTTIRTKATIVSAVFYPPLLLLYQTLIKKFKEVSYVIAILCLGAFLYFGDLSRSFFEPFVLFFGLLWVFYRSLKFFQIAVLLLGIGIIINMTDLPAKYLNERFDKALSKRFRPDIFSDSETNSEVDMANYIKANTDKESLLLVMPRQGRLRIWANRALVVDGYGMPMNDKGLEEWWYRMNAIYNKESEEGFKHIRETGPNYNKLTDRDFLELQEEFDFQYAVVKASKETNHKVAYANEDYKLLDFTE